MNNEFYKTKTAIAAILILIGFLLPWISIGFISISGFNMVNYGTDFIKGNAILVTYMYSLYLLPILSCYLLYTEAKKIKEYQLISKLIIIIIVLLFFIIGIIEIKSDFFKSLSIGYYISLIASILLIIQIKKEVLNPNASTSESENTNNLNANNFDLNSVIKNIDLKSKNSKISIGIVGICIIGIVVYLLLSKNSYQKTMNALEENKWEEVIYYYDKSKAEMASKELQLDYDENKKLNIAFQIAKSMQPYQNFKEQFEKSDLNDQNVLFQLDETWVSLYDLNNKIPEAELLGLNLDKIFGPSINLANNYNIILAKSFVTDTLIEKLRSGEFVCNKDAVDNVNKSVSNVLGRIIETSDKKSLEQKEDVFNKLTEINKICTEQAKQAKEEEKNNLPFIKDIVNVYWMGEVGETPCSFLITKNNKNNFEGNLDINAETKTFKGTLSLENNTYLLKINLNDNTGSMVLKINKNETYKITGIWNNNDGSATKAVELYADNS